MSPKKEKELDLKKVNKVLFTADIILNILLVLLVVLVIYVVSNIFRDWKLLTIIINILKVISPLFFGFIFAWLLDPVVSKLSKKNNRVMATLVVTFILILFVFIFFYILLPILVNQINVLSTSLPEIIGFLEKGSNNLFARISMIFNYDFSFAKDQIVHELNQVFGNVINELPATIFSILKNLLVSGINIFFSLVIGIYMLLDFKNIKQYIYKIIPKRHRDGVVEYANLLNNVLYDFVKGTAFISLILFVLQSLIFTIIGLRAPLIFGLFIAITNIIPYAGPWIGGIPAVIVGFSMSPFTGILSLLAAIFGQTLDNYILQPLVMGKTMNLHPVTIMVGLLIFGNYFGIVGMIFATPIIASLKLTIKYLDSKFKLKEQFTSHFI